MSTNSEDLRLAIEQLRPKLPQILGPNYPAFEEELETLLLSGTENQLLDLFGRYPDAHEHLLDILNQQQKEEKTKSSNQLAGEPFTSEPTTRYICNFGPSHIVPSKDVLYDGVQPVCPQHRTVMIKEGG